jgi:chromate transporter
MSTGDAVPSRTDAACPSLLAIAAVFGRVSATSFGGGQMAAIRREVVRRRAWLTEADFLELLSIAQILPGANPTNVAVMVGSRLRGAAGAAAALFAAVVPGFAILMVLAALALGAHAPALTGALRACAAVAVGLTCANAIEMTLPRRRNVVDLALIAAVAAFVLFLHASLALTLVVFIPVALVATRKRTP